MADPQIESSQRHRGQAVSVAFLVAFLVALLASGCSMTQPTERPDVDLQTAKSATMANEREMVALIDDEDIVDTKQNQTSALLDCSDGRHLWTGQIYVTLAAGADGPGYVQKIKMTWTGRDGWTVTQRTTAQGQEVVDINSDAGYNHALDYSEKNNAVRIMSFSPCFTMDPPYEYGNDY